MGGFRIASIVLVALGLLLLIQGALFKVMHWPNILNGLITGSIILSVGIILFTISIISKK